MSKAWLWLAVVGVVLVWHGSVFADKGESDKEKLQGTWKIVSAKSDGKPLKEAIGGRMTFTGDKVAQGKKDDKEYYEATYELDASRSPKQIDLILPQTVRIMAVYAVAGGELTLSYFRMPDAAKKRPSEFGSNNQMLMVFKRVK